MKRNYHETKQKFINSLSPAEKKTFAFMPGEARNRCEALGLFQGRTPNSPDEPSTTRGKRRKAKRGGTAKAA